MREEVALKINLPESRVQVSLPQTETNIFLTPLRLHNIFPSTPGLMSDVAETDDALQIK